MIFEASPIEPLWMSDYKGLKKSNFSPKGLLAAVDCKNF